VPQEAVSVTLDHTGSFTVSLLPCDAANVAPVGWSYLVTQVTGYANSHITQSTTYAIQPAGTGTVNLANLSPLPVPSVPTVVYVPLSGGTMLGPLILSADPTQALQASTKEYVDAAGTAANSFTTAAVAVETTRAQTAEVARQLLLPAPRVNWGQPNPVITHFQTGHGWTANNWGSSNLNDTNDFVHGSQVVTGTTPGNAGIFPTFTKTGMTPFTVVGQTLRFWVKCDNPANLASITLRIAGTGGIAGGNYLSWTIQQTSLDSTNQVWCPAGQWVQMSLPMADAFSVGAPTPSAIAEARIIVNDGGTAATVHFAGIDVYNGPAAKWPNGVVTLCFDDSYVGQYTLARPLLGQYGYRATLFPIWDQVGAGGSMTIANMHLLHDLLDWEVAPHASTLANHSGFGGLTAVQIQADITASLAIQQTQGFGSSGAYAYPLGYFSTGQDAAVTELCKVARTIDHTMYTESLPVGQPLRLRSAAGIGGVGGIGVTTYTTATTGVFALTKASPAWTILTIHDVSAGVSGNINQISIADLTTLVASINSQGLAVATMGEVIASGAFGL
jgi:peptidoglycan/xylan/chitin deacetylase (PgdA/CDA1 family)